MGTCETEKKLILMEPEIMGTLLSENQPNWEDNSSQTKVAGERNQWVEAGDWELLKEIASLT